MQKQNSRTTFIIAVVVLCAGVAGFFIYKHFSNKSVPSSPTTERAINSVDYGGPTKDEQKAGDLQKDKTAKQEELNNMTQTGTRAASVTIVDSSQYDATFEVRAYVSNVFEDGGTCTATLTRTGSTPVTQAGTASASATTTQCATIQIPVTNFDKKGEWSLTVSYTSPTAHGSTTPKKVSVQ